MSARSVVVLATFLVLAWWVLGPVEALVVESAFGGAADSEVPAAISYPMAAGGRTWSMPRIVYWYYRWQGLPVTPFAIRQIDEPVTLDFRPIREASLSQEEMDALAYVRLLASQTGRCISPMRLEQSYVTIRRLSEQLDLSAGRFIIRLPGYGAVRGERATQRQSVAGDEVWQGDGARATKFVVGEKHVVVTVETRAGEVTVQPIDAMGEDTYAVWRACGVGDGGAPLGAGHSVAIPRVGRGKCALYDASRELGSGAERGGDERTQGARTVRVVVSPIAPELKRLEKVTLSIEFLQEAIGNTFGNAVKLNIVGPQPLLPSDSGTITAAAEDRLWSLADELSNEQVSEQPFGALYEALTRVSLPGEFVVYLSAKPGEKAAAPGKLSRVRPCGAASGIPGDDARFFAVVDGEVCLEGETTLAHEVGHLLGGRHELMGSEDIRLPGHAWRWPEWAKWSKAELNEEWSGTVMAEHVTQRVPYFSHPGATCDGHELGDRALADNAGEVRRGITGTLRKRKERQSKYEMVEVGERPIVIWEREACRAFSGEDAGCWSAGEDSVFFSMGKAEWVNDAERGRVVAVVDRLVKNGAKRAILSGFADDVGGTAANTILGRERIKTVMTYLVERHVQVEVYACNYGNWYRHCEKGMDEATRRSKERRVDIVAFPEREGRRPGVSDAGG